MLDIFASYHRIQFWGNLIAQTLKNGKKTHFRPDLDQIWVAELFFTKLVVDIVPSYHPMQFKGKLMNQTWENGEKPNFGAEF